MVTDSIQIGDKVVLKKDVKTTKIPKVYLVVDINNDFNRYSLCMLNTGISLYESELVKVNPDTPLKGYTLNVKAIAEESKYWF